MKNTGRFQPGRSGNPKGRPKLADSITDEIRLLLAKKDHVGPDGKKITRARAVAECILSKSIKGDRNAQKLLMEYMASKPATEVHSELTGAVTIKVIAPSPAVSPAPMIGTAKLLDANHMVGMGGSKSEPADKKSSELIENQLPLGFTDDFEPVGDPALRNKGLGPSRAIVDLETGA